jgi:ketosteroid isomerase-like protein
MTQENVEIVRRFFDAQAQVGEAYWKQPYSYAAAFRAGTLPPEAEALMRFVHPEMEWTPAFSTKTYRGYLGAAEAWDEFLEAAGNYVITVNELIDAGADRVIAVVDGALKGKGSGIEVSARMCVVVTLRDGLVWRSHDYLDLQTALEAAGLSEQDAHADS